MRSISGVGSHDNKTFGTKEYCIFGVRHGSVLMSLYSNERGLVRATIRSQTVWF
jgi:hypothetical protein